MNQKAVIYIQSVMLKVRMNDEAVGRTKRCQTQRMVGKL